MDTPYAYGQQTSRIKNTLTLTSQYIRIDCNYQGCPVSVGTSLTDEKISNISPHHRIAKDCTVDSVCNPTSGTTSLVLQTTQSEPTSTLYSLFDSLRVLHQLIVQPTRFLPHRQLQEEDTASIPAIDLTCGAGKPSIVLLVRVVQPL